MDDDDEGGAHLLRQRLEEGLQRLDAARLADRGDRNPPCPVVMLLRLIGQTRLRHHR